MLGPAGGQLSVWLGESLHLVCGRQHRRGIRHVLSKGQQVGNSLVCHVVKQRVGGRNVAHVEGLQSSVMSARQRAHVTHAARTGALQVTEQRARIRGALAEVLGAAVWVDEGGSLRRRRGPAVPADPCLTGHVVLIHDGVLHHPPKRLTPLNTLKVSPKNKNKTLLLVCASVDLKAKIKIHYLWVKSC